MADIVLKDRNGNSIEYPGVNHIKVKTTDGATKDFIARTPVETTVDLDFSGGAMEVNPEAEELFSKVNIPVPANLIPENIAEGVNIAGIIGALTAGGAKFAYGKTSSQSYGSVINHGLGVVPDIILVSTLSVSTGCIRNLWGISGALRDATGWGDYFVMNGCYYNSSGTLVVYTKNNYITAADSTMPINNANETSFVLGSSTHKHNNSTMWIAIGGLT